MGVASMGSRLDVIGGLDVSAVRFPGTWEEEKITVGHLETPYPHDSIQLRMYTDPTTGTSTSTTSSSGPGTNTNPYPPPPPVPELQTSISFTASGGELHGLWVATNMIQISERGMKTHVAPLACAMRCRPADSKRCRAQAAARSRRGARGACGAEGALAVRRKRAARGLGPVSPLVNQLRPVVYRMKKGPDSKRLRFGFLAEELEKTVPEVVVTQAQKGAPKGVLYQDLIAILTAALQEQQAVLGAERKARVRLEEGNLQLERRIAAVEDRFEARLAEQEERLQQENRQLEIRLAAERTQLEARLAAQEHRPKQESEQLDTRLAADRADARVDMEKAIVRLEKAQKEGEAKTQRLEKALMLACEEDAQKIQTSRRASDEKIFRLEQAHVTAEELAQNAQRSQSASDLKVLQLEHAQKEGEAKVQRLEKALILAREEDVQKLQASRSASDEKTLLLEQAHLAVEAKTQKAQSASDEKIRRLEEAWKRVESLSAATTEAYRHLSDPPPTNAGSWSALIAELRADVAEQKTSGRHAERRIEDLSQDLKLEQRAREDLDWRGVGERRAREDLVVDMAVLGRRVFAAEDRQHETHALEALQKCVAAECCPSLDGCLGGGTGNP